MSRTRRRLWWAAATVLVVALVGLAVGTVLVRADRRQADDPRSPIASGAGALGQLLADEGVEVTTTSAVEEAAGRAGPTGTLVVVSAGVLTEAEAARLRTSPYGRIVLLRPSTLDLRRFGVAAEGVAPASGVLAPGCADETATRAGGVTFDDMRASYRGTGAAELACYPTGDGFGYLRASATGGQRVDLLAGGITNRQLAREGNAALALGIFGSQPTVVWLMAQSSEDEQVDRDPTLLPGWWQIAVVQAVIALVAVGVWRGRRLGPLLTEPLPVRVRATETVEGHGRLYHRLGARGRAAEALRAGARGRLGTAYGHADDPLALSAAVAERTGSDPGQVRALLYGPEPIDDAHLVDLAKGLDHLEQEARQL
jgi:hypothetical protein